MAPSGKKKKKPQKTARPIATTSAPSKAQLSSNIAEESAPDEPTEPTVINSGAAPIAPSSKDSKQEQELQYSTPDELERHLRDTELQALVDQHGTKVAKESTRTLNKLRTDCRLLLPSSELLTLRRHFPQSFQSRVLGLTQAELDENVVLNDKGRDSRLLQSGEVLPRLWNLRKILQGLGFAEDQIQPALKQLVAHPPSLASAAFQEWGLSETLTWLALYTDEDELPNFDGPVRKITGEAKPHDGSDGDITDGVLTPTNDLRSDDSKNGASSRVSSSSPDTPLGESDFEVSDVESDLDPQDLLTTYLSAKSRLFEKRPELVENPRQKKGKGGGNRPQQGTGTPLNTSRGVRKLQEKLKRLEGDALFDQKEADYLWTEKRNLLARELAQRQRIEGLASSSNHTEVSPGSHEREVHSEEQFDGLGEDDDDLAIGELFGAISDDTPVFSKSLNDGSDEHRTVSIRDFGKWQGVSPRRVLQEACKARDSKATLTYKIISTSAFSYRHSLVVRWTKSHPDSNPLKLSAVACRFEPLSTTLEMTTIATPDSQQSEAFISTIALFQLFANSPKEEKAHLRLPHQFRQIWTELVDQSRDQAQAAERETIENLLTMVNAQVDQHEDEDELLKEKFQKRSNGTNDMSNGHPIETGDTRQFSEDEDLSQRLRDLWQEKTNRPSYQRMLEARKRLPMYQFREQALEMIDNNPVSIISGETGCGKSTQLPAYILSNEMAHGRPCKIYCTEPRRISAITLAQRVAEELGENKRDLGTLRSLVGYAIRLESLVSDSTRLVYATTGIVLRMLESAEGLRDITHIVIDEVHERSIETDFLLIILKSLLIQRPDLKVILMSATLDSARFSVYFGGAPTLSVPGRTFPVDTKYLGAALALTEHKLDNDQRAQLEDVDIDLIDDVTEKGDLADTSSAQVRDALSQLDEYRIDYELIVKLIFKVTADPDYEPYAKAILVFLPGLAEIKRLGDMLAGTNFVKKYIIHSLHSTVASEDQQAAFALPPPGMGKCVISTNIAETGVTIPDITCVIDTGKHKEMRFDERRQISRLMETFISKANAKQRRGRAGRVQEGLCFHLFTKARHDRLMADQQTPEMLRLSLQDLVMRVKICKLGNIEDTLAQALDPPLAKNVRRAIDSLIEVDALTRAEQLTPLGQLLARLPLDPYLGKLVLLGSVFGCVDFALTAAAILTSKSPFISPIGSRREADLARASFKKGGSDLLTEYNAYAAWRRVCLAKGPEFSFCRKNFLSLQTLSNIEDLKAQLFSSVSELDLITRGRKTRITAGHRHFTVVPAEANVHSGNLELLSAVVAWAFYPKTLAREGNGWRNIASNQQIQLHPTSILRQSPLPTAKYVSFYSILQSGAARAYNASSITPVSLLALTLLVGDAEFHPVAHVLTIDNSRLRVRAEGWKAALAVTSLRRHIGEILDFRWKKPAAELPRRLVPWMQLWNELVEEWMDAEARKEGANFASLTPLE